MRSNFEVLLACIYVIVNKDSYYYDSNLASSPFAFKIQCTVIISSQKIFENAKIELDLFCYVYKIRRTSDRDNL